jgi:hypothetical protein
MMAEPNFQFTRHPGNRVAARRTSTHRKGRPPPRQCPDDFDVIFVEIGRLECEAWYRARRTTIDRWLAERGKQKLIDKRAAYVRHLRNLAAAGKHKPKATPVNDNAATDQEIVRMAAHYLRLPANGGWVVSPTVTSSWRVGLTHCSPGELLERAIAKGFDVKAANLQLEAERRVG